MSAKSKLGTTGEATMPKLATQQIQTGQINTSESNKPSTYVDTAVPKKKS